MLEIHLNYDEFLSILMHKIVITTHNNDEKKIINGEEIVTTHKLWDFFLSYSLATANTVNIQLITKIGVTPSIYN